MGGVDRMGFVVLAKCDMLSSLSFSCLAHRVVDGTWHMPMWKRDADAEYLK